MTKYVQFLRALQFRVSTLQHTIMLRRIGQRPCAASDCPGRLAFTEHPLPKLSKCNGRRETPEPETRDAETITGVCYYRKALHLEAIARELLADGRANRDPDVIETTNKLLSLVADIRADNRDCWDCEGACPKCPEANDRRDRCAE